MIGLIADEQNGFRRGRSCSEHIFLVTSIIRNRLTEGKDTFIAFVDKEKAFDWIRRPLLYYLLLECNIDGKIYKAIKALYTNNTVKVRINASLETDWFRQVDPLSATLFNIFINGLVENLKLLNIGININGKIISILLYADDIILLAKSEPELQSLLLALESWCKYWQLNVNISKTKIIHFRNIRKKCTKFKFVFYENELGIVDSFGFLFT